MSAPHYIQYQVQLHTKELASYDLQLSTNQGKTKCKPNSNQRNPGVVSLKFKLMEWNHRLMRTSAQMLKSSK